jgi:hypothetical protein
MGKPPKTSVRQKFKKWLAVPKDQRAQTGYKTQKEFAQDHDVHYSTLSEWKNDPTFMNGVENVRRSHLDRKLSDIYQSLIRRAEEGDFRSIKLAFKLSGRLEKDPRDQGGMDDDPQEMSDYELVETFADLISSGSNVSKNKMMLLMLQSLEADVPKELVDQIKQDRGDQPDSTNSDEQSEGADQEVETNGSAEGSSPPESQEDPEKDPPDAEQRDQAAQEAQRENSEGSEEVSSEENVDDFDIQDPLHEDEIDDELRLDEELTKDLDEDDDEDDDAPTTEEMSMPPGW